MTDLDRCHHEQAEAGRYLSDPAACAEWANRYGCTVEQARAGAEMGLLDWLVEESMLRGGAGVSCA